MVVVVRGGLWQVGWRVAPVGVRERARWWRAVVWKVDRREKRVVENGRGGERGQ